MSWRRRLLVLALGLLALSAALAVGILLAGDFGETEGKLLATTFAMSVASLLALPGAMLWEQRRAPPLALAAIVLPAAAFALFLVTLWGAEDEESLWRVFSTLAVAAGATTQVAATTLRTRAEDSTAVRALYFGSIAGVTAVAALLVIAIWAEPDSEAYVRVIAAFAVVDVALVLAQPLVRRLAAEPAAFRIQVTLDDGTTHELELHASDFAAAAADAVRRSERGGRRVVRLERD